MNTTRTLEVGQYLKGDLAAVRCDEPDPFDGWVEFAERNAHDLRSVRIGGRLAGVIGYFMRSGLEADSFALIDRKACAGYGGQLTAAVRQRQAQWILDTGVAWSFADCSSEDRAAQVFLRALGYIRTTGAEPGKSYFVIHRSKNHG